MKGMSWLLVVFALLLAFASVDDVRAGPDPTCVLCAGAKKVPCPTCAGKGRGLVPCDVCDGKGKVACRQKGDYAGPKLQALIAALNGHVGAERACPNPFCIQGTIKWETSGKTTPCRLCGGSGKVHCADCQTALTPCAACGGRGKIEGRCLDCAGTGALGCDLCSRQDKCPQCAGANQLPCPTCDGTGTAVQSCEKCGARGTERCDKCFGVGRTACAECNASGRSRMVFTDGTSASSTKCSACDGKGTASCAACKGTGRSKCSVCDGAKRVAQQCRSCDGHGKTDCRVCAECGYRGAELEASVAAKPDAQGQTRPELKEAAVVLLQRAVDRAREFRDFAADATNKAAAKLGKSIEPPADGASVEERRAYVARARAALEADGASFRRLIGASSALARAQEALTRCEKALAALRPPAPK